MAEKGVPPGSSSPTSENQEAAQPFLSSFVSEIIRSPMNLALVAIIAFLVYKIIKSKTKADGPVHVHKQLPKLRRDFTVEELRPYDGTRPDGRILLAINRSVYDVTKGSNFYGPGGPYAAFGGRDASRGLALFSVSAVKDEYDDLSDLNTEEMSSVREWEEQFKERYDYVGKLLKPGEAPTNYSDEEEEGSQQESQETKNDEQSKSKDD